MSVTRLPANHRASLRVSPRASTQTKLPNAELKFGATFSDHMLEIDWTITKGWGAPKISPYHKLELDPACSVYHYALECFEGMKAYVDDKGKARLFRPRKNLERLQDSMHRMCFPSFAEDEFAACLEELVRVDKDWIPRGEGFSLYLRPTAISTHPYLGVGRSTSIKLFVIASPVGPYYPEGFKPVSLFADTVHVRAWPGGTGASKVGANYAPTILPQALAAANGYSQVLWLFGRGDAAEITEVGTMNFFAVLKNDAGEKELVTPPLDGTILPGVTRDSILQLARDWREFKVSERNITIGELTRAINSGRLLEAFGAGTAAVVSPIRNVHYENKDYAVPIDASIGAGPITKRFWDSITGIQYGKLPDKHGWSVVID